MTLHLMDVKTEVERLRKRLGEKALIIAGGSHSAGDPKGTLSLGFDYVFVGEADQNPCCLSFSIPAWKAAGEFCLLSARKTIALGAIRRFLFAPFFAPIEITPRLPANCHFAKPRGSLASPAASADFRFFGGGEKGKSHRIPADHIYIFPMLSHTG